MTDQHVSIYLFFPVSKNTLILLKRIFQNFYCMLFLLYIIIHIKFNTYKVQFQYIFPVSISFLSIIIIHFMSWLLLKIILPYREVRC